MKVFFVYVDWTTEENPRPFYIGKGNAARVRTKKRNRHHTRLVNLYGMRREVVYATKDEQAAFEFEEQLIAEHRTFVHDGWGANFSRGGEGPSGYRQSPETRARHAEAQRGKHMLPEVREILSKKRHDLLITGWQPTFSEEARQRISEASIRREAEKKLKGWTPSHEARRRMSESGKRRWAAERASVARAN